MKLHELRPSEGAFQTKKELDVELVLDLEKQVEKDIKDKMLEVVEELDLDLKVDNYHYSDVYQKEVSLMLCLKQNMLQLT